MDIQPIKPIKKIGSNLPEKEQGTHSSKEIDKTPINIPFKDVLKSCL